MSALPKAVCSDTWHLGRSLSRLPVIVPEMPHPHCPFLMACYSAADYRLIKASYVPDVSHLATFVERVFDAEGHRPSRLILDHDLYRFAGELQPLDTVEYSSPVHWVPGHAIIERSLEALRYDFERTMPYPDVADDLITLETLDLRLQGYLQTYVMPARDAAEAD